MRPFSSKWQKKAGYERSFITRALLTKINIPPDVSLCYTAVTAETDSRYRSQSNGAPLTSLGPKSLQKATGFLLLLSLAQNQSH